MLINIISTRIRIIHGYYDYPSSDFSFKSHKQSISRKIFQTKRFNYENCFCNWYPNGVNLKAKCKNDVRIGLSEEGMIYGVLVSKVGQ